ncbi:hypothetical protein E5Q_02440 [Mixia osmundae IAM 14324]|uniref:Uncharacterized protein n=1 Tax=Mixia osmundae (strain CBS 9802 / IAM 14324 / JCM 22182 / KY 12970) TaxID=764103 RepID=G7DYX3_MIXOS|nr:hypothetical protein E5Q_02440 [Mixia osmundae IAM 14324]
MQRALLTTARASLEELESLLLPALLPELLLNAYPAYANSSRSPNAASKISRRPQSACLQAARATDKLFTNACRSQPRTSAQPTGSEIPLELFSETPDVAWHAFTQLNALARARLPTSILLGLFEQTKSHAHKATAFAQSHQIFACLPSSARSALLLSDLLALGIDAAPDPPTDQAAHYGLLVSLYQALLERAQAEGTQCPVIMLQWANYLVSRFSASSHVMTAHFHLLTYFQSLRHSSSRGLGIPSETRQIVLETCDQLVRKLLALRKEAQDQLAFELVVIMREMLLYPVSSSLAELVPILGKRHLRRLFERLMPAGDLDRLDTNLRTRAAQSMAILLKRALQLDDAQLTSAILVTVESIHHWLPSATQLDLAHSIAALGTETRLTMYAARSFDAFLQQKRLDLPSLSAYAALLARLQDSALDIPQQWLRRAASGATTVSRMPMEVYRVWLHIFATSPDIHLARSWLTMRDAWFQDADVWGNSAKSILSFKSLLTRALALPTLAPSLDIYSTYVSSSRELPLDLWQAFTQRLAAAPTFAAKQLADVVLSRAQSRGDVTSEHVYSLVHHMDASGSSIALHQFSQRLIRARPELVSQQTLFRAIDRLAISEQDRLTSALKMAKLADAAGKGSPCRTLLAKIGHHATRPKPNEINLGEIELAASELEVAGFGSERWLTTWRIYAFSRRACYRQAYSICSQSIARGILPYEMAIGQLTRRLTEHGHEYDAKLLLARWQDLRKHRNQSERPDKGTTTPQAYTPLVVARLAREQRYFDPSLPLDNRPGVGFEHQASDASLLQAYKIQNVRHKPDRLRKMLRYACTSYNDTTQLIDKLRVDLGRWGGRLSAQDLHAILLFEAQRTSVDLARLHAAHADLCQIQDAGSDEMVYGLTRAGELSKAIKAAKAPTAPVASHVIAFLSLHLSRAGRFEDSNAILNLVEEDSHVQQARIYSDALENRRQLSVAAFGGGKHASAAVSVLCATTWHRAAEYASRIHLLPLELVGTRLKGG